MNNAKKIVEELNGKLFMSELHDQDYFWYLEYTNTPIGEFIKYYGQIIWDSENDYRAEVENTNDGREDMRTYLIKEIGKVSIILHKSRKLLGAK